MLIQVTKEDGTMTSVNVNHIVKISPTTYDRTKILLINGEEIVWGEEYKNAHIKIKAIYLKFYKL